MTLKLGLRNNEGFTLTEMMIVIALIALVSTFVIRNVMKNYRESQISATKIQMRQLAVVLDDFRRTCNFYPTTDQGLDALVKAPAGRECKNFGNEGFLKSVPKDAWNNNFEYICEDGSKYTIRSLGADGKAGGEGDDKDITSEEL